MSGSPGSTDSPRWSGLDGLRALAVVVVVAFHFAPNAVPGGFLGVDIFFVLSGYLITRMIATEYVRSGSLRFGYFYRRRARRLLPGLAVVLVGVLAAAAFWRDQLTTVRSATLAAAGYVSNWWLSFAHQSYFVTAGRPSMLQHLWSLAVEEQFYLLWPAIAIAVLAAAGRMGWFAAPQRRCGLLAVVAGLLALGSATEMTLLAIAEKAPYATDASRLYYGTDTHSMGLLLGAAFGALAAGRPRRRAGCGWRPPRRRLRWLTDVAAAAGVAALLLAACTVSESSPGLYRGGFLAFSGIAALTAAFSARAGSRTGRGLDRRPLRWLAARSYAIYLWHWPIAVVTRPGTDLPWPGWLVLLFRCAVTMVLADATYRLVERPIRTRGLLVSLRGGLRRIGRAITGSAPVGARLATALLATGVLLAAGVLIAGPKPQLSASQRALAAAHGGRDLPLTAVQPQPSLSEVAAHLMGREGLATSSAAPAPPASTAPRPAIQHGPRPLPSISAYGDSVILGARLALQRVFPGGAMDAVEGRQADPILADIDHAAAAGKLNPLVIIHVGDNGLIDPGALRHTLSCLRHVRQVIVVNDRVGRDWQDANNRTIASVVPKYRNASLLDWHRRSARHGSWFYDDGIHLTASGAVNYARLLASTVRR